MRKELRCPHGLPVSMTMEKGLVVYRHVTSGEYCPQMNSFDTTPEDILQVMIRSILDNNEFDDFLELDQTLQDYENALISSHRSNNRFHEFAIMFKRSAEVRALVYKKIADLSASLESVPSAMKLFSLVLVVLSDDKLFEDERKFKAIVSDFMICYGIAFKMASESLSICKPTNSPHYDRMRRLLREIEFQRKYVFNTRTSDKFDISLWGGRLAT
ncbi:MAG: hypothetical protein LBO21_01825 [Synergistaceae bacterium]|jgi:hypothetical protein|nr:hypothetical protein [Synergistaceae bacterium]